MTSNNVYAGVLVLLCDIICTSMYFLDVAWKVLFIFQNNSIKLEKLKKKKIAENEVKAQKLTRKSPPWFEHPLIPERVSSRLVDTLKNSEYNFYSLTITVLIKVKVFVNLRILTH